MFSKCPCIDEWCVIMSDTFQIHSPIDGSVYAERPRATAGGIARVLDGAEAAQRRWRQTPLDERRAVCRRAVDILVGQADAIAVELAWQMGRPVRHGAMELRRGFRERADFFIEHAGHCLAEIPGTRREGFELFIRREPVGIVFVLSPWNYPYLTAVNAVLPALLAGNAVVMKQSAHTLLCAERISSAFAEAGAPDGTCSHLHISHEDSAAIIGDRRVGFVAFTGSVPGGRAVQQAARARFIGTGLELGGKDPAYVRPDAELRHAIDNIVDGAFFNSGQSCCGIERVYVHEAVFDAFVEGAVALTRQYVVGNPLEETTTLGPMVCGPAADFVRGQIIDALSMGARPLIGAEAFPDDHPGSPYLPPQILVDVNHRMRLMREETFGPAIGIMRVGDDAEAIRLMNDSDFGLTASVWTRDLDAARRIGDQVETGTFFMNRCDYLDPSLAWTGVKDSGHGCTLSTLGFDSFTRPKSFHMRLAQQPR